MFIGGRSDYIRLVDQDWLNLPSWLGLRKRVFRRGCSVDTDYVIVSSFPNFFSPDFLMIFPGAYSGWEGELGRLRANPEQLYYEHDLKLIKFELAINTGQPAPSSLYHKDQELWGKINIKNKYNKVFDLLKSLLQLTV